MIGLVKRTFLHILPDCWCQRLSRGMSLSEMRRTFVLNNVGKKQGFVMFCCIVFVIQHWYKIFTYHVEWKLDGCYFHILNRGNLILDRACSTTSLPLLLEEDDPTVVDGGLSLFELLGLPWPSCHVWRWSRCIRDQQTTKVYTTKSVNRSITGLDEATFRRWSHIYVNLIAYQLRAIIYLMIRLFLVLHLSIDKFELATR